MTKNSEQDLISLYKSTKEISYISDLYAPYMPLVYGVCLKYLANRENAQDAVMDIFEKLTTELLKQTTPENFKVWLYVVTKNFCLMKLRGDGAENRAFKKMSGEFMENGFEVHPIDEEGEVDLNPLLKECLEKLKKEQQTAIKLFYYKKCCYREIAEQLDKPEKKIKSDIQNGRRNLKICIEANTDHADA